MHELTATIGENLEGEHVHYIHLRGDGPYYLCKYSCKLACMVVVGAKNRLINAAAMPTTVM
jgi:hypothetical protein